MEQAAQDHFKILAEDNEASSKSVVLIELLTSDRIVLQGTQNVKKFNSVLESKVTILMGVLRLESHQSDILVTVNTPRKLTMETFNSQIKSLKLVNPSIFL